MKALMITVAVLLALLVVAGGIGGCTVKALNTEVRQRNLVVAKSDDNEAALDAMWKIIKQKANISQEAVAGIKDFTSIYQDLVEGRSGGTLFKMVTESNPDLPADQIKELYQDVMRSVEAERKQFRRDQKILQDLVRERKDTQGTWPSSMAINWFGSQDSKEVFVKKGSPDADGHPEEFCYTWVTSGATKQMVATGEENDLDLFSKPKAEQE